MLERNPLGNTRPPNLLGPQPRVLHLCPRCPIGNPGPFCQCCGGAGNVDEARLAQYQRHVAMGGDVPREML